MRMTSLGRSTLVALTFAFCPAHGAAVGDGDLSLPISHQSRVCGRSTDTIKQLATIENAADGSFQCLGLALQGDAVRAIRLETHRFAPTGLHPDAEQVVVAEFLPAVVESRRGAVLDGVPGHDAIMIQGHLPAAPGGGQPAAQQLTASYLYNGFTGDYRACRIMLERREGTGWRLVNRFSGTISRIVVKTRQMPVIGAFGIASLEGACS